MPAKILLPRNLDAVVHFLSIWLVLPRQILQILQVETLIELEPAPVLAIIKHEHIVLSLLLILTVFLVSRGPLRSGRGAGIFQFHVRYE